MASEWGAAIVDRNVAIGGGELDLIVDANGERIAVEVKTSTVDLHDAAERFDDHKQYQVTALGRQAGCGRVDLVTVHLTATGYFLRWVPDAG